MGEYQLNVNVVYMACVSHERNELKHAPHYATLKRIRIDDILTKWLNGSLWNCYSKHQAKIK